MSIMDRQALFSDEQAVTVTAVGSDFYDTSSLTPARNIGGVSGVAAPRVAFTVDQAAAAAGAATVTFEVLEADDGAGTVNPTVIASSGPVPIANLTLGARPFEVALPKTRRRYVGVRYTIGTGPLTAGKFTAVIVLNAEEQNRYPGGYTQAF